MIDRDIDLTEDLIFRNYEKVKKDKNTMINSDNFFDFKNFKNISLKINKNNKYIIKNAKIFSEDIYNIPYQILDNYQIANLKDYNNIVNNLLEEGKISLIECYEFEEGILFLNYFCEKCGEFIKNNEIGKNFRVESLCNNCIQDLIFKTKINIKE